MSVRPTFFGFEIAKSGLYVSQKGLDVTGHNVSNVETAGYTRQRIINTSIEPYYGQTMFKPTDNALIGAGAKVMVLDQVRSAFLDRQFRTQQTAYGGWATRTQGLTYVESLFENSDGSATLSSVINELFKGFNTLNGETADQQQRTYLKQQAIKVSEQFNHIYDQLIDQQRDQNTAVNTVVFQINKMADELAILNKEIYAFEMDGRQPANDLRDKRNLIIDQLSTLVDVEYTGDALGSKFEVKIAGKTLVNHTSVNKLAVVAEENVLGSVQDGFDTTYTVCWASKDKDPNSDNWERLDLKKLSGGELLAHINLRDKTTQDGAGIPYFINELNALAQTLVQAVNAQHRQGYTHPAGDGTSVQGVNFFNEDPIYDTDGTTIIGYDVTSVNAGNIRISDALEESVYNIAASDVEVALDPFDPEKAQVGNNKNSLALFALSLKQDIQLKTRNPDYVDGVSDPNDEFITRGVGSISGFISSLVLDVAVTLNHSKSMTSTQNTLLLSADTQRTSVSGVSLDEEMTNLIKYNHAYSGASRVITTLDEALDVLINRMGRVGL